MFILLNSEELVSMFMHNQPSLRCERPSSTLANWEEDIDEVILESCEHDEDPSGYRVIFYKDQTEDLDNDEDCYCIGASYLKNRLDKLRRAGFDAPMTKKALNLIDKKKIMRMKASNAS